MEKKINIAEILKDVPKGIELYCTIFGYVKFIGVKNTGYANMIQVDVPIKGIEVFYEDGRYNKYYSDSECVLFPSKENRNWEEFNPTCQFKDGDILFIDFADEESDGDKSKYIFILKEINSLGYYISYCHLYIEGLYPAAKVVIGNRYAPRLATEEEKQKLFDAIKANGYSWNPETKTLEKLVEPKFDITTLVPFESKVLVRDNERQYWKASFWGCFKKSEFMYDTVRGIYKQCIPYEGNEHLLGKTDDCDEYFKTWE